MTSYELSNEALDLAAASTTLRNEGYLVLENAVSEWALERAREDLEPCFARAPYCDGLFYGRTTKRFGRLLMRLRDPERFALHPAVLALVRDMLGEDSFQLNLTQAIEIHPGAQVQTPHRDHDMWRCAKVPPTTYMVNVMWTLDAFTADNGATRIWPRSNHGDWSEMLPDEAEGRPAIAPAGSAMRWRTFPRTMTTRRNWGRHYLEISAVRSCVRRKLRNVSLLRLRSIRRSWSASSVMPHSRQPESPA